MTTSLLVNATSGAGSGSPPDFRAILQAKLRDLERRRHEIQIERVAEECEQMQIAVRNEAAARASIHDRNLVRQIRAALSKIDANCYGVCECCAIPIAAKRLEAVPWVRYCVKCQAIAEERGVSDLDTIDQRHDSGPGLAELDEVEAPGRWGR